MKTSSKSVHTFITVSEYLTQDDESEIISHFQKNFQVEKRCGIKNEVGIGLVPFPKNAFFHLPILLYSSRTAHIYIISLKNEDVLATFRKRFKWEKDAE